MEVRPTAVTPNITAPALTVRRGAECDHSSGHHVFWLLPAADCGGSHNSVLVEFRDFLAVVSAAKRGAITVLLKQRLVPNKPIQYVEHAPSFRPSAVCVLRRAGHDGNHS
jgi:hypothetical protein